MRNDKWSNIADMNERRCDAACTVYEGKIVVSGGRNNKVLLKSVERYDFYENKWTYLPDMIEERSSHSSFSMGSKLFVIGGPEESTSEVFDNCSRHFCYTSTHFTNDMCNLQAICKSKHIIVCTEVLGRCPTFKMFTHIPKTSELMLISNWNVVPM